MIYTVTFHPAIDYYVAMGTPLQLGALNRARAEALQFGGKGINVSRVLQTLGLDTVVLGFKAGFIGNALQQGLDALGLKTDLIELPSGNTRINVKVSAKEETEINGLGPDIPDESLAIFFEKISVLHSGDVLVLSGSVGNLAADTYANALSRVKGRGILTVVDASGELLRSALPYRPFLIKPNYPELCQLVGRPLSGQDELFAAAAQLQSLGARNVLVSLGEKGALLLEENGKRHQRCCPKGSVISTVGAGDSMVAGFLAGYMQTDNFETALRLGIAAGSATAFSTGLASKAKIEEVLLKG